MSHRTAFDFSVGGAIVQNSTQLSLLREHYGAERRTDQLARSLQEQASILKRQQEEEQARAVRAAEEREIAAQHAKVDRQQMLRARAAARHAALHEPIAAPNLLPFSAHYQRMPPPLKAASGSVTSRRRSRVDGLVAGASLRMHTQQQAQQLLQQCQQQAQQTYAAAPQQHAHASAAYPSGAQTARQSTQHYQQQPHRPSPPPTHRPHPPMRGAAAAAAAAPSLPPWPSAPAASPPPARLTSTGHLLLPHPFYTHGGQAALGRVVNQHDRAFLTKLDELYPADRIPPAPLDVQQQREMHKLLLLQQQSPPAAATRDAAAPPSAPALPPPATPYNINGWSVAWGAQKKKCRETRIEEFLISKRYL